MASKKVLIVEDNLPVLVSYLQILETLNLDITPFVAATYEGAQKIFLQEKIDLIILDLVLPDALATSVLADIRRIQPDVSVLLVTGYPEQVDEEAVEQHRVRHVFKKPLEVDSFARVVRSSLNALN
jgi:response regulator RpfG family c-di-GMP phosphodiesterase